MKSLPDVLTQAQVNDLPDGTPVVVLQGGDWQRGFTTRRTMGVVHAVLGIHTVYPLIRVGLPRGPEVSIDNPSGYAPEASDPATTGKQGEADAVAR